MAEVTGLRQSALPYPVYGAPYGIVVPILDADGDPVTGASGLDSELSKNGDTPADCTNEATEIGNGWYYLLLTATELTADVVAGIVKTSTSGAKNTPFALYPRKLVTIRSGASASGGSDTDGVVLDSGASDQDDFYNGMLVLVTIDGNVEARIISDYVGSTKKASVVPDFNVAPDNNDTFIIKLPEGWQIHQANLTLWKGSTPANLADTDKVPASVQHMANNTMTAAAAASDLTTELQSGLATAAALATVDGIVDDIKTKTDNLPSDPADQSLVIAATTAIYDRIGAPVGASLSADVADVEGKVDDLESRLGTPSNLGSGATIAANLVDIEGQTDDIPTAGAIADAVWEEPIADHSGTSGSTAEALGAAGAAGDPWITPLPGSYSAGQAGYIVGTNLDAPVSGVPDAMLDQSNGVETGLTVRGALRLALSALAGKLSGANTNTSTFRNAVADSKNRIVADTDATGRTSVTTDTT